MTDRPTGAPALDAGLEDLVNGAMAGVPPWRRSRTRRELLGYIEDALTDELSEGLSPAQAVAAVRARFGHADVVAEGFRSLPPPVWARGVRRSAAPMGVLVVGLILGLVLVQLRTPAQPGMQVALTPDPRQLELLHVQQVEDWHANLAAVGAANAHEVSSRLGVSPFGQRVLEPSVRAYQPEWLPDGFDPAHPSVFLSSSATILFFARDDADRAGVVIESLRPDRSTVFQIKERHVFPVQVGAAPGFYIDGEWEVRGPADEQPAPASWRTDRSHSILFTRDGLLVLVAGPADLDTDALLRIARSVR
jgi:hypothetical protein